MNENWRNQDTDSAATIASAKPIKPMAHRDMHARTVPHILAHVPLQPQRGTAVLDLGAGTGSMSQKLMEQGYAVSACDLHPELFQVVGVRCKRADLEQALPYQNATFDAVVCMEVLEHLDGHLRLFREVNRILKPGGRFLFSTPNIMSIKSRLRFLFTGYLRSFEPLGLNEGPITRHISGFSPDRYRYMLDLAGLELGHVVTDKFSRNSLVFAWLIPLIRVCSRWICGRTPGTVMGNSLPMLLGRSMIGIATKVREPSAQRWPDEAHVVSHIRAA
jgi:SAM-dependent methyltransferase